MKTIIYTEIDKLKIIRGIGELSVDGVETQKKIMPLIRETEEFKEVSNKKEEISNRAALVAQAKSDYRKYYAITQSETASKERKEKALEDLKKSEIDYNVNSEMINELQKDLSPLNLNLEKKGVEIFNEFKIYFEPTKNEMSVSIEKAAEITDKLKNLNKSELLCEDGSVIIDSRGKEFWSKISDKWESVLIEKLTDETPEGGKIISDLTDAEILEISEQKNADRILELTVTEKENEKLILIDNCAAEANTMKGKLVIQGVSESDALKQAQDWYGIKIIEIEDKYK